MTVDASPQLTVDLLDALPLQQHSATLFRGQGLVHTGGSRLYGGELVAQSLRACGVTVPAGQHAHSLHSYYLRPANVNEPFEVEVAHVRDGRSFAIRTATLRQRGKDICSTTASFHTDEPGVDAISPLSQPGPPPGSDDGMQPVERGEDEVAGPHIWDTMRIVPLLEDSTAELPSVRRRAWVRLTTSAPEPADRLSRACLLAYLTDIFPLNAAAHAVTSMVDLAAGASLDHAVWFHRDAPIDGWLLFELRAMSLSGARGTVLATLHTAEGAQLASVAQETLVRPAA